MTANAAELRNRRLLPLAEQAREIWSQLRQESNVDLQAITLEGTNTSRRVSLEAAVDGESAGALSVMSQGELHALALALFIPRATAPGSPFRFLVLDDPIQAMDPAKVEGFVRVLERIAATRQVIVFSHDDRLATAIRNLAVDARIVEITRGAGSTVTVAESTNPARRYIDDAEAVLLDENVPAALKARVVPGIVRLAVEAAARDAYFRRSYAAGRAVVEVEAEWEDARTTQAEARTRGRERPRSEHRRVAVVSRISTAGLRRVYARRTPGCCRRQGPASRSAGDGRRARDAVMTPEEALAGAQRLLDASDTTVDGARLAAFVARQALEQLVDQRCRALDADCPDASMRSKLVVLRALGDPDEADAAEQAWSGLSAACHRHPYELEPAGSEVRDLCAAVVRLMAVGNG